MLSAGNQVSFSKYQKGYNKRCSIVRRPVIWGSVVLIYLPILIRMNIGIYRGKAVRNLEAVMILGAFGLFIGYLLVSISDGSRVQDSFQSACRKAAAEAFPRRDGMDSLVLKAEENAPSLTDEERRMLLTSYAMGYMRRIQTDSGVAIPTMLFSAAEMLYKQEVAERAQKNAGSTNSCSSCSTRRYDRFLRCWARSGSTSALAC